MNHFKAGNLAHRVGKFAAFEAQYSYCILHQQTFVASDTVLSKAFVRELTKASLDFKASGINDASRRLKRMSTRLGAGDHPAALQVLAHSARELVVDELKKRKFLRVASDRKAYLDRKDLFGSRVSQKFPSADLDILASGNCLAAECSTACVFHLMRVAEQGLRALANDRRVQIPNDKPLELANWEEIIKELEKAETEIQGYPRTLAREAQYEFYHGAMLQFRGFKNAFRNQIMHTRKEYDRQRALSIFNQVREFMQILAGRISETTRTPRQWKGKKWTATSA